MADLIRQIVEAAQNGDITPAQIHEWAAEHGMTESYIRRNIRDQIRNGRISKYSITEKGRAYLQERDDE